MKHTFAGFAFGLALLLSAGPGHAQTATSGFDYYVLSLSWSPQYCATNGEKKGDPQCAAQRRYGFVLHGLWPQYAAGQWPESCVAPAPAIPAPVIREMLPIQPSEGLIRHEWAKHGTCSHQDAAGYFAASAQAYRSIRIPEAYRNPTRYQTTSVAKLAADFAAVNPGLDASDFSALCRKQYLVEIYACLDKELKPTRCGGGMAAKCGETVILRPVR